MASITFDGDNKTITLDTIGAFTAEGIYSDWKEWINLVDNKKYLPAFSTSGGEDVGQGQEIAPYFFVRNDLGWVVKMPSDNGEIIIQGNLFPKNPALDMFSQTAGFDAFLRLEVSTRAVVVQVPVEVSALSVEQDATLTSLHTDLSAYTASALPKIRSILVDTTDLQENQGNFATADVSTLATTTEMAEVKANQNIINEGVQVSSNFQPHTTDIN